MNVVAVVAMLVMLVPVLIAQRLAGGAENTGQRPAREMAEP